MTITVKQYKKMLEQGKSKKSKWKNVKVYVGSITFDSKKEHRFAQRLEFLQKSGKVLIWGKTPTILLTDLADPNQVKMIPDFFYIDDKGIFHIVDTKGKATPDWINKKKFFENRYKIPMETK